MYSALSFILGGLVLILVAALFGYTLGIIFRVMMVIGVLSLLYGVFRYRFRR